MGEGKEGRHYRFRQLEYWAQSGLINIVDERYPPADKRSFEVVVVREMLFRLRALNSSVHRIRYADERNEVQTFIENMVGCCKEAQKQGRPDDPKAVADMLRHRRRNYILNDRQATVLHTAPADQTPEGKLLPPIWDSEKVSVCTDLVKPDNVPER